MKGHFANGVLRAFEPDVVSYGPWYVGKMSSQKLEKSKEDKFCAHKFDVFVKLCKN